MNIFYSATKIIKSGWGVNARRESIASSHIKHRVYKLVIFVASQLIAGFTIIIHQMSQSFGFVKGVMMKLYEYESFYHVIKNLKRRGTPYQEKIWFPRSAIVSVKRTPIWGDTNETDGIVVDHHVYITLTSRLGEFGENDHIAIRGKEAEDFLLQLKVDEIAYDSNR